VKPHSITQRVVALVLLVEVLSALCLTGFVFVYERQQHFHSLDLAIRGRAGTLLGAVVEAQDEDDRVVLDLEGIRLPKHDIYEVWDNEHLLLGRSDGWHTANTLLDRAIGSGAADHGEIKVDGTTYRTVVIKGIRVLDPQAGGIRHRLAVVYGSPTQEAWEPVAKTVRAFALASSVLLVVSGLLVTLLIRTSMNPLKELAREAGSISSSQWQFVPSERARAMRELAPLATALEDLVLRLGRSFAQQRQFVSDSAHELKTAVTVVKSSLQLLELRERNPEEYRAGVVRSLNDCLRMEELVHRMLTLARAEAGVASVPVGAEAVTELHGGAMVAAASLESLAQLRGVRLECTGPTALHAIIAPPDWETVCVNLLLNAMQHSERGSRVLLTLEEREGRVVCRVIDHGAGIPAAALSHIFDRFYRSDASRARSTGGSGLGLAIVKAIVDGAHGEIQVESTEGAGTTVTVRLTTARLADRNAEAETVQTAQV
jgi:signal transduction histidine kinase